MKNQNPIEILSKDVKYFDAQNSIIGSLIRKVKHQKKKKILVNFWRKHLTSGTWKLEKDLRNFMKKMNFLTGVTMMIIIIITTIKIILYEDQDFPVLNFQDKIFHYLCHNLQTLLSNFFLYNFIPPPPSQQFFQPPLPPKPRNLTFQRKNDVATNTTETFSGDRLIGELKKVIEKKNTH